MERVETLAFEDAYQAMLDEAYNAMLDEENELRRAKRDVHIAHIMHTLIEKAEWAFEDILSIQSVKSSIEVGYQSSTDVEPMECECQ